jgi:glyoxylase-like metal-dependent hydrolase (beta-lactamase superfamily II)
LQTDDDAPVREAVIVDPGVMDEDMLKFLENGRYHLAGILVTHNHRKHVHGIRTLRKIYNADIYAVSPSIMEYPTIMAKDGDVIRIGSFVAEVITVPGHSSDSAAFKMGHILFTGDALEAGLIGRANSSYGTEVEVTSLRSKILSLPEDCVVLAGHGPPSTLEAERRFNAGIDYFEEDKRKRHRFRLEY